MQKLIFILLTATSLFFVSCGEDLDKSVPINTQINMNGFLDDFRGGKITVEIYHNSSNTCENFLDPLASIEETFEKDIKFDIPELGDIQLAEEDQEIKPGVKTIYVALYDKDNQKKGQACEKAVKCSLVGEALTAESYNIGAGDKACVYLSISLIE